MTTMRYFGIAVLIGVWVHAGWTQEPRGADSQLDRLQQRVTELEKEVRDLKKVVESLRAALSKTVPAIDPTRQAPLVIKAAPNGWKDASPADIQAVCLSAAREIWKEVPGLPIEEIQVSYSERGPMTIFGVGPQGQRRVWLNVQGPYWSQVAYQFAHEFCHILCQYRESDKSNHWFEESLCETASLFVLRRMAESWKTNPPYSNWKSYSDSLKKYVDDHMARFTPLKDMTFLQWYQRNADALRKNNTDRPRNQVVARELLPLFEDNPKHWAALAYLNQWEQSRVLEFSEYLQDWHDRVPPKHKDFVRTVADRFGVTIAGAKSEK